MYLTYCILTPLLHDLGRVRFMLFEINATYP